MATVDQLVIAEKIREKIFAGRAALEEQEQQVLFGEVEDQLEEIVREDLFRSQWESLPLWQEVLGNLFPAQLAHPFMTRVSPDRFYQFGTYLRDLLSAGHEKLSDCVASITHDYLDLFRLSPFLQKIYQDSRWVELIENLVRLSRFNVNALLQCRLRDYPDKVLFRVLHGSSETSYTWRQVAQSIERYGRALLAVAEPASQKVAFLTENSLTMALLDLACLKLGIVNVMIPANSVPQHVAFILNETEASVLLVSNEKQLMKVKSVFNELKHLKQVVLLEGTSSEKWVLSHKEFLALGDDYQGRSLDELGKQVSMDGLTSIMYTSGTTGDPKGIMFSQMNIIFKRFCRAMALPEISDQDRFLSYLPLFHTFGRWLEMMGSIFWGASYAFMENPSVDTMIANMQQVEPTVFISIPKKWLQLYEAVCSQVDIEIDEEDLILQAVREVTGGKLRWGLSAAGFLPPEVFQFFQKYGIELMSGFGMTEATGGITMTPPGRYRPNSLGKALPGIEIKVAEDGELLIRGPYVMLGYFGQPRESVFTEDGWFPTGDIMRMEADGFIEIIDRKKEIYKNIKGETIAPQKIENYFRDFEQVQQVFLVGDHRPFNTALIYPNYQDADSPLHQMSELQKHEYFSSLIVTVNKFLAPFERIVDFRLIDRPFSEEYGELTPKGTYKRRQIEKNFAEVIEEMYTKNYISLQVSDLEIRIPNWFLREKGCLSRDVIATSKGIAIPKQEVALTVQKRDSEDQLFRIGDYEYRIHGRFLDFQVLLTNPLYWLGNDELFHFAGEGLFLWYRQDALDPEVEVASPIGSRVVEKGLREQMEHILAAGENSLFGLHIAAQLLRSGMAADGFLGVKYLRSLLNDESLLIYRLATRALFFPKISELLSVRRELFKTAVKQLKGKQFDQLLRLYLNCNFDLLDDQVIHTVVELSPATGVLAAVEEVLHDSVAELSPQSDLEKTPVPSLLELLCTYGVHHPTTAKRVRQTIVRYQLHHDLPALKLLADQARAKLRRGFRQWLGTNQTVAVDVETGEEYTWDDVIILEQDIDPADRERLIQAIKETPVLREAIFLFSEGTLIRLNDILPGGIWVSLLDSQPDKTVYRVTVQSRFQGSFDVVLNLMKDVPRTELMEEMNWLILAGSERYFQELAEDFGGYWEEFNIWSAKYSPGKTVQQFLTRSTRKADEGVQTRLYHLWPFFVWNAAAAYCQFWQLTGRRLQLARPTPDQFVIPSHDYQTGTRIVSFSERMKFDNLTEFFENFYHHFVAAAEQAYPFLRRKSIWNYIFSGVINAEGEQKGIELLEAFLKELRAATDEHRQEVAEKLAEFLAHIRDFGFIPKQLFFAIKRYHRWLRLNQEADYSARAQTLQEIYDTYHLPELERTYPETRTRFFLETVFVDSSEELKKALQTLVQKQHAGDISKEEILEFLSTIQSEFSLSEKDAFFLTRLTYPHVKPTDAAELVKVQAEGGQIANLVVQLEDYDGNPYSIRAPISPKEISKLHQLFLEANLLVHFRPEHKFLVALSDRGFIIGGLFYSRSGEDTVYMDKIVVADRYRRKGISEGLMNEFFNRMRSENIRFVTTGFFRPEYFYRFGFKIERKYSGLVKELTEPGDQGTANEKRSAVVE